jgi:hypothetical protein
MQGHFVHGIPDISIPDVTSAGPHTTELSFLSEKLDFAILQCKSSLSPGLMKCQSPTLFGSLTRVPSGWMALIQSRCFRVFNASMTETLCQLKTPVVDIPMGRSIPTTCRHKWTVQIVLFRYYFETFATD